MHSLFSWPTTVNSGGVSRQQVEGGSNVVECKETDRPASADAAAQEPQAAGQQQAGDQSSSPSTVPSSKHFQSPDQLLGLSDTDEAANQITWQADHLTSTTTVSQVHRRVPSLQSACLLSIFNSFPTIFTIVK